jgi:chromosome segregation ATPase
MEEREFKTRMEHEKILRDRETTIQRLESVLEASHARVAAIESDRTEIESKVGEYKTTIKIKDEIISDLSDQLKKLKAELGTIHDDHAREIDKMASATANEMRQLKLSVEFLENKLLETTNSLGEKEDTIKYISGEVEGIKAKYEERIIGLRIEAETQREAAVTEYKAKIRDAVATLVQLDTELIEEREIVGELRAQLVKQQEDNERLRNLNNSKFLQIKSILSD